ncbi:hypothetical protein Y032_0795g2394 [Ancylostoma ceylanicum]|uniref:UPAR/Ly6 domain-containing protein n=1 Tax=Ancylostoma ceylanicum TaxID=53326 RepID=A0A016WDM7_9BILA|nr:hypothetical protein Y032_0795g2394 [Ancylostoma ceylanicum]
MNASINVAGILFLIGVITKGACQLDCYHGSENNISKASSVGNCVLYQHYNSTQCYRASLIYGSKAMFGYKELPFCGVYVEGTQFYAVCLCNKDYCNTAEKMVLHGPSIIVEEMNRGSSRPSFSNSVRSVSALL